MRPAGLVLAALLGLATVAQAQTTSTPAAPTAAAPPTTTTAPGTAATTPRTPPTTTSETTTPRRSRRLADRFAAANTTHDGKLTLEQARAGHMRAVVRDFSKIDTANRGYVTLDDIRGYQRARRAASRANHTTTAQ